jgi:hypothetical protein
MAVGMKAGPKINTHIRTYKILQKKEELIQAWNHTDSNFKDR